MVCYMFHDSEGDFLSYHADFYQTDVHEQYGLFSVYTSWLQILTIFSTFRLDYSVFNKGMSKYPEDRDGYASSMLGLTTVINTALLVLYFIFRKPVNAFTELNTFLFLCMFCSCILFRQSISGPWRQRYEFRYRMVVFVTVLWRYAMPGLGWQQFCCLKIREWHGLRPGNCGSDNRADYLRSFHVEGKKLLEF